MDTATLQQLLKRRDSDLLVLREDGAAQQEELMHALAQLQVGGQGTGGRPASSALTARPAARPAAPTPAWR